MGNILRVLPNTHQQGAAIVNALYMANVYFTIAGSGLLVIGGHASNVLVANGVVSPWLTNATLTNGAIGSGKPVTYWQLHGTR